MTVCVIIPALNEAESIGVVLAAIPAGLAAEVIVVDNGSTDDTAARALAAGARVVREDRRGYGFACAAGVAATQADIMVFLDADLSDFPEEMAALLAPIQSGQADLVLGSRFLAGNLSRSVMPPQQRFGNWLASRLMQRLYRIPVTDLSPFRAVRRDVLLALDMREMTYGWPTEMMVKAARRGYRLTEIAVRYRARYAGRSKVSGTVRGALLAAYYILGTTLRYAWQ
ncbi:glycosyltransferase family 2 protein [Candidatus Amarolinea dominans]|uniref:glycosyltransferase family 2 protein n=1 Tax=Candidatus Amarolinea dominans TaxID=3140696 RepID=UPI001E036DE1|nr:glycosyltransferase family 2 protein [Anaerolineae bacterium]